MREITQSEEALPGSPRSESIDLGNRLIPFSGIWGYFPTGVEEVHQERDVDVPLLLL